MKASATNEDLSARLRARLERPGRIVLVATHWLGDTFWALQVVPLLARRYPAAEIHLVLRASLAWLGELWAAPERVHPIGGMASDRHRERGVGIWKLLRAAGGIRSRIGPVDLAVDLTNTPAAGLFIRQLRARVAIGGGSRRLLSFPYDAWQPLGRFRGHLAEKPWWVIAPLLAGVPEWPTTEEQRQPSLPRRREPAGISAAPADAHERREDRRRAIAEGAILLFPGAGWPEKRWPLDRFVELARKLAGEGHTVVLLFAPGEDALEREAEEACRAAVARDGPTPGLIRAATVTGPELLAALDGARAVVSNDSGAAHLAAARGLPTVAIHGPTNPRICGPLGSRVRILRTRCPERPEGEQHHCHDVPAYPCDLDGLRSVGVAEVHGSLHALLKQGEGSLRSAPGVATEE